MGAFHDAGRMFQGVSYNKVSSAAVKTAMEAKIKAVAAKIAERHNRVRDIMQAHEITDAVLGDIIIQYMKDQQRGTSAQTYSISNRAPTASGTPSEEKFVPAGVVANLVTEKELIESEKAEVDRMNLILRNLKLTEDAYNPTTGEVITRPAIHKLTDEELLYLGF